MDNSIKIQASELNKFFIKADDKIESIASKCDSKLAAIYKKLKHLSDRILKLGVIAKQERIKNYSYIQAKADYKHLIQISKEVEPLEAVILNIANMLKSSKKGFKPKKIRLKARLKLSKNVVLNIGNKLYERIQSLEYQKDGLRNEYWSMFNITIEDLNDIDSKLFSPNFNDGFYRLDVKGINPNDARKLLSKISKSVNLLMFPINSIENALKVIA